MRGALRLAVGVFWLYLCCISALEARSVENGRDSEQNFGGCEKQRSKGPVDIYVSVSSLSISESNGSVVTRQLEVNWNGRIPRAGDTVALFDKDPNKKRSPEAIMDVNASDYPTGYWRSEVDFPFMYFNITSLEKDPCLGYWAAYLAHGRIMASTCLQMRPFWMRENRKYLQHQVLSKIMIPGSHDSGCFSAYSHSYNTVGKFKYAQDEPIFNQLIYGIRYFDFRVGYYKNTEDKFYINHSFLKTDHSVKSILLQIRSFLEATQEIVIIDFHLFPVGFKDSSAHPALMQLIYDTLNPYFIPFDEVNEFTTTISKLWAKNQRILVSYNHVARKHDKHGVLWPGLMRAWGNKQQPDDLKKYFEGVFSHPMPKGFLCAMAELTPNTRFIMMHPTKGLRRLADEINRNVTSWFRDLFWEKSNIVATDYFLGNNLIDVAIEINREKSFCSEDSQSHHKR